MLQIGVHRAKKFEEKILYPNSDPEQIFQIVPCIMPDPSWTFTRIRWYVKFVWR